MAIDARKVLVGAPDQSATTGAVNYAATTATMPGSATEALPIGFKTCGYVSEDGVTLTAEYSTTDIKDWSLSSVRTLLEEFTGEVSFAFIQTDYDSLVALFGPDYVSKVAATADHGEQVTVKIGAHMAPSQAYVFNMKDGSARIRIVLPNAQPVLDGDLTFIANEPIKWNVKLKCSADASGESIYIHTDDGMVSA